MKHATGPVVLFLVGMALIVVSVVSRRRRRPLDPVERRAAARFLWDMLAGSAAVTVFACYMLAPRHVLPGQRIPRPKARRMVRAMNAADARKMIR